MMMMMMTMSGAAMRLCLWITDTGPQPNKSQRRPLTTLGEKSQTSAKLSNVKCCLFLCLCTFWHLLLYRASFDKALIRIWCIHGWVFPRRRREETVFWHIYCMDRCCQSGRDIWICSFCFLERLKVAAALTQLKQQQSQRKKTADVLASRCLSITGTWKKNNPKT